MTPAQTIAQRRAGIISTEEMMEALLRWSYTFGRVVYVSGVATDSCIAGDWDEILMAFYRGELTDEEFLRIADAQHRPSRFPAGRDEPTIDSDGEHLILHVERIVASAFSAEEVAAGLGITNAQVAQRRVARELWAITAGTSWRFPTAQFDIDPISRRPIRQIRGLAQVLPVLPEDLRPAAIDGFLHTPQPDLYRDRPQTPREWLRAGGDIRRAVSAALASDWYSR